MRNIKLINHNLNVIHDQLQRLSDSVEAIDGKATRAAARIDLFKLVKILESLDGFLTTEKSYEN